MTETAISPMVHELGKYWEQPPVSEILVDDKHAVMSATTLFQLKDYSHSNPTGRYAGKMWRTGNKYLHWYIDFGPTSVVIETRIIILL